MAWIKGCAIAIAALLPAAGVREGPGTVLLRAADRVGESTHVIVELKAEGLYRPNSLPGGSQPRPLTLKVETRFDFVERVLKIGDNGLAQRVVRRVNQAASAINGQIRASSSSIRPEVGLLAASMTEHGLLTFSPGGPLTRSELELVQGPGDPLALAGLLADRPVGIGDSWAIGPVSARALSDYDALASNTVRGKLEAFDDSSARVRLAGEIQGAARGGEGTIVCDGSFTFDRKESRIVSLNVTRVETRKPGPVEAGLDLKGTLTVERRATEVPAELTDAALAGVPLDDDRRRALLVYSPPRGNYTLLHDRDWHIFWDDPRLAVLKRLDHGEVVAQCNLAAGPRAGKGRHQDPAHFRDDIRRALGTRFGELLGAGEVEGEQPNGYRYKVAVQGREGDIGIRWYYYMVAGPEGDQVLVTFTLAEAQAKAFGDQDLHLIGSLEWKEPGVASKNR